MHSLSRGIFRPKYVLTVAFVGAALAVALWLVLSRDGTPGTAVVYAVEGDPETRASLSADEALGAAEAELGHEIHLPSVLADPELQLVSVVANSGPEEVDAAVRMAELVYATGTADALGRLHISVTEHLALGIRPGVPGGSESMLAGGTLYHWPFSTDPGDANGRLLVEQYTYVHETRPDLTIAVVASTEDDLPDFDAMTEMISSFAPRHQ